MEKNTENANFLFVEDLMQDYVPPAKTGDDLADAIEDVVKYRDWRKRKSFFDEWINQLCLNSNRL